MDADGDACYKHSVRLIFILSRVVALIHRRADIYGLLRFGRFRPWNDWADFNDHVVSVNELVAPSSLRIFIYRRKFNMKMLRWPVPVLKQF